MAANQPLIFKFGADVGPAQKGLQTLARAANDAFGQVGQAGAKMAGELAANSAAFGALAKAAQVAGFANASWADRAKTAVGLLVRHRTAIISLSLAYLAWKAVSDGVIGTATERLAEYVAIADKARKAGIGAEFAQAFPKIAGDGTKAKDDAEALAAGLMKARDAFRETVEGASELSKRIDEIAENGGFTDSGLLDKAALGQTSDHEQRIRLVLKLIDDLVMQGRRLEGLDLAEKLFGAAAADALFRRMDATRQSLTDLVAATQGGQDIVKAEDVQRADDLRDRLEAAKRAITEGLKQAMDDIASAGIAIHRGWVSIVEAIGVAAKAAGGLYSIIRSIVTALPNALATNDPAAAVRSTLMREQAIRAQQLQTLERSFGADHPMTVAARQRLAGLDWQTRKFNEDRSTREPPDAVVVEKINPLASPHPPPPPRPSTGLDHTVKPAKGGGGRAAKESVDATERQIEALEKSIRLAQVELESIGKTNAEKEKALALAKADSDATDAQKQKLAALGEQYGALKDRIEAVKKAHDEFVDQMNEFGSGLSDAFKAAILDGKSLTEVMHNLSKSLAGKAIDRLFSMFFGGGGVKDGGILGSLLGSSLGIPGFGGGSSGLAFGGPRAEGGPVVPGAAYWVGERGPELVTFDRPGMVHPAGSGALQVTINDRVGADFRVRQDRGGVTIEAVERVVSARIAANNRMLPGVLADAQRRM